MLTQPVKRKGYSGYAQTQSPGHDLSLIIHELLAMQIGRTDLAA